MSDYKHEWVNDWARYVAYYKHGEVRESANKPNTAELIKGELSYLERVQEQEEETIIQRYTDRQMELEARGEGWVPWNAGDKIPSLYLEIKTKGVTSYQATRISHDWLWMLDGPEEIIAYRLSNAEGYKNGVKVERQGDKLVKEVEEMVGKIKSKEWKEGDLPADGTKCEACWKEENGDMSAWHKVTFKRGFDSKLWFSCNMNEYVIPAHDVTFRPIRTHKEKVIEKAKSIAVDRGGNEIAFSSLVINDLYDAGMLSLPNDKEGE